ncbi:phospholipase C, phosphocholine-specific [Stenotrophomonas sp. S48]|uniref:phosphocholine-specific phospholipase C n=1 Tax=unclassified Stenotrophomonas TaxID=196198 RepID=UPI001901945A|nr:MULTISPECIES: phospholipase C, phosphocholine-specific [unclassified Stenotrophomonas]MBK0027121.1 phospholipase C, phosphocholine-specific [Stenotrophomonas sp. S48]MBK0048196.1 phospholipase C, phosphocholine-specific [Stenotrophomonas sp. S49]
MTDIGRRRLLQAGVAAGLSPLLPSIARAAAIAPAAHTRSLQDLQHIVVFMQENRSFDHYFGTLPGVRGFGDRFVAPAPPLADAEGPRTLWLQPDADGNRAIAPFALDTARHFGYMRVEGTPHTWPDAQRAWDHGRMAHWPQAKQNHSMGYFQRADLPFQFALAEAFTVCDAYHCAMQAGTNPNRVFLWTGHNDAFARAGGPVIANSHDNFPEYGGHAQSYQWASYVERLQQAGVSWQIYQDMDDNFTDNPLAGFEAFRQAYRGAEGHDPQLRSRAVSSRGLAQLRQDVIDGTLPQVSFIIADAAGSEHPGPSSPAQGAAYTARVLDALTADPDVWSRTALLLMFDENDGFFDHMPPPAPPSAQGDGWAGASAVSTEGEYHLHPAPGDEKYDDADLRGRPYGMGPRVPLYVISPWSRGGWVDSQVYDHTSVLRLIERRFGVACPDISPWRRAVSGDLVNAFDFAQRDTRPFVRALPDVSAAAARAATLPGRTVPALPDDLQPARQESGVRPARALPYRPQVQVQTRDTDSITLALSCEGAAAVLHVYDRLRLEQIPRRYTLLPGHPLQDHWPLDAQGRYDLWVLGPNGFHRHFQGNASAPALQAWVQHSDAKLRLSLRNPGTTAQTVRVSAGAYAGHMPEQTLSLAAGAEQVLDWNAAPTAGWYDLHLQAGEQQLRLAGRAEDGRPGSSDPAMGSQPLRFAHG